MRLAFLVMVLMAVCAPCLGESFMPPVVMVRRAPDPGPFIHTLTVNGIPAWSHPAGFTKQPPSVAGFVSMRNKGFPTKQTDVALSYDGESLFVHFRCDEDELGPIIGSAGHDGPVWRDDSVEIMLDPKRDGRSFFHFIINAGGARYEERRGITDPKSWNGAWHAFPTEGSGRWNVLAIIPFSSLGVPPPGPNDVWYANLARHEVLHEEMSTWSPVIGEFAEPQWFGRIVFGGTQAPIISAPVPGIGAPGKYSVTAEISNASSGPLPVNARTLVDGEPLHVKALAYAAPRGESKWDFEIDYPLEGSHKLGLEFTDPEGRVLMRTAQIAVNVPPHRSRLNRFRQIVRDDAPTQDIRTLRLKLEGLVAFERTARGGAERWAELGKRLDAIEPEVTRVRYASADSEGRGYVVGTETSLTKVLRDNPFDGQLAQPLHVSAARNESEGAQVVIVPYDTALEDVEVSISTLTGPGGAQISAGMNLVGYVQTRKPKYDIDYVGWWPDPLMPMKSFDVPKGSLQPVWITVHPSEKTPAGIYKGSITVKPKNAPESSLPVEVRVWDFALPVKPHLRTAFALFEHEIAVWYGGMTEDVKRSYYSCMLDHRLNVMNLYSKAPLPRKEDMQFCFDRGQNFMTLAYTHNKSQEDRDQLADMIREHRTFMEPKGWWDKACIYGFDEVKPPDYGELRDMYGWLGKEFPDLPRMCTVEPNEELKGSVDIWVPITDRYSEKIAREYEAAGDQVWWYVCCVPAHPYPNFFIDYPAIDQRIIFWMNWKYRIPGFLYYAVDNWTTNRSSGKRWPEVEWNTFTFDEYNGDGHLIYPGPDGMPISSIRLECIRDGIEDYDYFAILDELVRKAGPQTDKALLERAKKLLAVDDRIVGSPCDYTLDPALILHTRQEVAETIEKLRAGR